MPHKLSCLRFGLVSFDRRIDLTYANNQPDSKRERETVVDGIGSPEPRLGSRLYVVCPLLVGVTNLLDDSKRKRYCENHYEKLVNSS
jgi:hypothetical protein